MLSRCSHVQLFATPWTIACQAPWSMGFSRQEYCNGWPCPPPGDLPDSGTESKSLMSLALAGGFFTIKGNERARRSTTCPDSLRESRMEGGWACVGRLGGCGPGWARRRGAHLEGRWLPSFLLARIIRYWQMLPVCSFIHWMSSGTSGSHSSKLRQGARHGLRDRGGPARSVPWLWGPTWHLCSILNQLSLSLLVSLCPPLRNDSQVRPGGLPLLLTGW